MLLGSDLDGVVIDIWRVLEELFEQEYGVHIPYSCVSRYKIEECTELSEPQVEWAIDKALRRTDLPFYQDAVHHLRKWMRERGEVVFVTSRGRAYTNETFLNLAEHFTVGKFKLYFSNGVSKAHYIDSLGVDFFVEDRVKHSIQIAEKCPGCSLLLMDRPWNRDWDEGYYENVTRVKDWEEVIETLSLFG